MVGHSPLEHTLHAGSTRWVTDRQIRALEHWISRLHTSSWLHSSPPPTHPRPATYHPWRHGPRIRPFSTLTLNHGIDILTTVPPPRLPSKVKKLAMGGSRAARALRMSCASRPPTTAQTGESSCAAVVATVLSVESRKIADAHNSIAVTDDVTRRVRKLAAASSRVVRSGHSGEGTAHVLDELLRDAGQHLLVHVGISDKLVRYRLELWGRCRAVRQCAAMGSLVFPYGCSSAFRQSGTGTSDPIDRSMRVPL